MIIDNYGLCTTACIDDPSAQYDAMCIECL